MHYIMGIKKILAAFSATPILDIIMIGNITKIEFADLVKLLDMMIELKYIQYIAKEKVYVHNSYLDVTLNRG